MFSYTEQELRFLSGMTEGMAKIGYQVFAGTLVTNDDVPHHTGVERAQQTTMLFVSKSLGTVVRFDISSFACCEHRLAGKKFQPQSKVVMSVIANFNAGGHRIFKERFFVRPALTMRERLYFDVFPGPGHVVSKPVFASRSDHSSPTYCSEWIFTEMLELCCNTIKTPEYFISGVENALRALDLLTQPFSKLNMKDWPPNFQFEGCEEIFWSRFRENLNVDLIRPILSALRA